MTLLSTRQKLVASNIANADTPGYKTQDIDFRAEFAQQMQGQECGGPQTTGPQTIEPDGLPVKADGNNVSLDRESRMLAENAMRYSVAASLARAELQALRACPPSARAPNSWSKTSPTPTPPGLRKAAPIAARMPYSRRTRQWASSRLYSNRR
jgi:flagellar basal-body rod protein FlgB